MKKLVFTLTLMFFATLFMQSVSAQMSNKEIRKTLKTKPPREVKKTAKDYEKQGYHVAVGAPSIENQLVESWLKEKELNNNGDLKYIIETGTSVGETQIAAKLQATEAAKLNIAGAIETRVAALIENNIANSQLNAQEATSVTQTIAASKSVIAQELGRTITVVEMYRTIDKNVEANVRLAYNGEIAMEQAKSIIRKNLEEKTEILQEKLDMLMKF